jgi:nucleoside-diphosphate kinase
MQRTLVLAKPDAVQRGLIGEIIARFERKGLKVIGLRLLDVPRQMAEEHYAVHAGKHFYDGLVEFITSGPVAAVAIEGPDAIAIVRRMVGKTMPNEAEPGTIRGDLGVSGLRNLIHASDAPDTAEAELALWFGADALVDYGRAIDEWIVAEEPARAAGEPGAPSRIDSAPRSRAG